MLILNEDLWEKDRIIKISCSTNWNESDTYIIVESVLKRLKELLIQSDETKREAILLCDCNKGQFPPMVQALQIVAFMVSIKQHIEKGLSYTIIYVKSEEHKNWIHSILKIYTPARPVKIISTKEEIKQQLLSVTG
jgi:hypothetical protein